MSLLLLPYVCDLSLSTEVGARNFTFKFLCKHSLSKTSPNSLAGD